MHTKRISILAISIIALTSSLIGAINVTLPGNSFKSNWAGLNAINYTTGEGYNSFVTNTAGWTTPIAAHQGTVTFDKLAGTGGYPSSAAIYNFTTPGSFLLSNSSPLSDLETLVFQLDMGEGIGFFTSDPVLNYNGGSQGLVAGLTKEVIGGYVVSNPGDPPFFSTNYAFQWDLTSIVDPITSYTIEWSTNQHVTLYEINLDSGDTFSQVIPEPSTYAAMVGILALAVVCMRRRFSHQSV